MQISNFNVNYLVDVELNLLTESEFGKAPASNNILTLLINP